MSVFSKEFFSKTYNYLYYANLENTLIEKIYIDYKRNIM